MTVHKKGDSPLFQKQKAKKRGTVPFSEVGAVVHFRKDVISIFEVVKVVLVDSVIFYLFIQSVELVYMVTRSLFSIFHHSASGHNECPI